jgi:hypothetical protein
MANRIYGEARAPLEDGRELTLRFDFGALAEAEEAADLPTETMMGEFAKGGARLKTARAMLYGALRYHHPEVTLEDAGELLMSDSAAISKAMGQAMQEMADRRSKNPPGGAAAGEAPKPSRGIGTRSLKSGTKAA